MKKVIFFTMLLTATLSGRLHAQTIDLAPSAVMTTTGGINSGGATARAFFSLTSLQTGQYILLDMGDPVWVSTLAFRTFWDGDGSWIPAGYTVDVSNDNSTWSNLVTVTSNTNTQPSHTINAWARYWKLTVTALQSGKTSCNLAALRLMTTAGTQVDNLYWSTGWNRSDIVTLSSVGIGTNGSYGYKLAVGGSMIAEEIKVKTKANWPDYVFKPGYRLPDLGEVKKHIAEKGHLPGIPSAEEVKNEGIDVGDMNARLLRKIEELTLYLVDLRETVDRQQQEIGILKRKKTGSRK